MHTAVATVGVVGKPDRSRGEIVKAYVVVKPDHKADSHLSDPCKILLKIGWLSIFTQER